jgi:hypothetical protein
MKTYCTNNYFSNLCTAFKAQARMHQIYQWVKHNELDQLANVNDDLSFFVEEAKIAEVFKSIEITRQVTSE